MKNIIIILSLLLLSFFLISCEKEKTLYEWDTSSGDDFSSEWKEIGDKNKHAQYIGEVKRKYIIFGDYILEGIGSMIWSEGDKYVGEFKDNKPNGQGTYTWSDGSKYVGEFNVGLFHGQGTIYNADGSKFVGEYKDGKKWDGREYDKKGRKSFIWIRGKKP